MVFPREVLNELRWRKDRDLGKVQLTYEHRGAPGDQMTISGASIVKLGRSFFSTDNSTIPYHRIVRIVYEGEVLYEAADQTRA